MITFMILLATLIIFAIVTIFTIAAGGVAFIIIFADVIVCLLVITWIIKLLNKKRKGS